MRLANIVFHPIVERLLIYIVCILFCVVAWSQLYHVYTNKVDEELKKVRVELLSVRTVVESIHEQTESIIERRDYSAETE